jgi:hypothetical protein
MLRRDAPSLLRTCNCYADPVPSDGYLWQGSPRSALNGQNCRDHGHSGAVRYGCDK